MIRYFNSPQKIREKPHKNWETRPLNRNFPVFNQLFFINLASEFSIKVVFVIACIFHSDLKCFLIADKICERIRNVLKPDMHYLRGDFVCGYF